MIILSYYNIQLYLHGYQYIKCRHPYKVAQRNRTNHLVVFYVICYIYRITFIGQMIKTKKKAPKQ